MSKLNTEQFIERAKKVHGAGQTTEDMINHAISLLKKYKPESLKKKFLI